MTGFPILLLLLFFIGYLIFLIVEALIHRKDLRRIPLRITVGGTRGKSTTVRMLASVLREAGMTVLAKTTGSEALYILPDGGEQTVRRRGFANIIEQKKLIRKAVKSKVNCVVAEVMSIHPENHRTETRHLLQPNLTLITNIRPDHLDVSGSNQKDLQAVYRNDEWKGAHIIRGWEDSDGQHIKGLLWNADLVIRAARHLGIDESPIKEGIRAAKMDVGYHLTLTLSKAPHLSFFVNTFAANDPLSTQILMDEILPTISIEKPKIIALLSLRPDRAERSEQWLKYLSGEGYGFFDTIYLTGFHAKILHHKLDKSILLKGKDPDQIIEQIKQEINTPTVCFGIGNIQGLGMEIVQKLKVTSDN